MRFLTEDDIRARCPQAGGLLTLGEGERLTPSAQEYASGLRLRIESGKEACQETGKDACAKAPQTGTPAQPDRPGRGQDTTYLDKSTLVSKTHPSIIMRGKLDSLLAELVLIQTRFDPQGRRPALLKQCLEDLRRWIWRALSAEITGERLADGAMGGMDADILHQISRDPRKYLGLDHFTADASLGGDIAELNRLRALVRENEVMAVACSGHPEVIGSLNRLSSAVYVLMLLTLAAEKGLPVPGQAKAAR